VHKALCSIPYTAKEKEILCIHIYKWKMIPVETTPRMGEWGIKENDGGGEFNYDIFNIL
jgi:hypothetical protein